MDLRKLEDAMKKIIALILLVLILVGCNSGRKEITSDTESILPSNSVSSETTSINVFGRNSAYATVIFPHQRFAFWENVNNVSEWNVICQIPNTFYVGGDFVSNDFTKLYLLHYSYSELHVMDTTTCQITKIGKVTRAGGGGWTGMAGTKDGVMYLSSTDTFTSYIYTVDLVTAQTTVVGAVQGHSALIDIAINNYGELYGLDIHWDAVMKINLTTMEGVLLGSVGFNANCSQDMDFNDSTGILYLAAYNEDTDRGELRTVNLKTGMSTLVGPFPENVEIDAFAFATIRVPTKPYFSPLVMRAPR
jgi:uncharacterized lipoprotein NlpE involved in copper resistance